MASVQFVGLDVHKDTIDATVMSGKNGAPDFEKRYTNSPKVVQKLFKSLQQRGPVAAAYEAGCMGFELQRMLKGMGVECLVIAPGKMPRFTSERIKTDRRDARTIAKLLKNGEVTPINVPTPEDEATRDFLRAREDLKQDSGRAKQRLMKFLLRHGYTYRGGSYWTMKFARWLSELQFALPLLKETFDSYRQKVQELKDQMRMLDERVVAIAVQKQYAQRVARLRCFRGIDHLIALALVVEVGDFRRFATAASFMAYLGLVPREMSSGGSRRQGGITKSGNGHLRKLLIEASWHYRRNPSVSKRLRERREGQPVELIAYANRAMNRLHQKYIKLVVRGKTKQRAVTAVARELSGFVWGTMNGKIS
jgi:transposase